MESLKIMEKFDGDNFYLWKFVHGSATIPDDEHQIKDYNEKATNAFTLLCKHLEDAQLAHIQYCENVKSA
jgi:hypothetical protein